MNRLAPVLLDCSPAVGVAPARVDCLHTRLPAVDRCATQTGELDLPQVRSSLQLALSFERRQLAARRVRSIALGSFATAIALTVFLNLGEAFVSPLLLSWFLMVAIGGALVGAGATIAARRAESARHALARELHGRGLRIEKRTVVTNGPHPAMVVSCRGRPRSCAAR